MLSGNAFSQDSSPDSDTTNPLRLLLITGGCCHDYRYQAEAMQKAFKDAGVKTEWKIVHEGGNGTNAQIELYNNPDWPRDLMLSFTTNAFADTKDTDYIRKITSCITLA